VGVPKTMAAKRPLETTRRKNEICRGRDHAKIWTLEKPQGDIKKKDVVGKNAARGKRNFLRANRGNVKHSITALDLKRGLRRTHWTRPMVNRAKVKTSQPQSD